MVWESGRFGHWDSGFPDLAGSLTVDVQEQFGECVTNNLTKAIDALNIKNRNWMCVWRKKTGPTRNLQTKTILFLLDPFAKRKTTTPSFTQNEFARDFWPLPAKHWHWQTFVPAPVLLLCEGPYAHCSTLKGSAQLHKYLIESSPRVTKSICLSGHGEQWVSSFEIGNIQSASLREQLEDTC